MDEITSLIKLIERKGVQASPLVNLSDDSLESKLYNILREENPSEEEVLEKLYGSSEKKDAFKMLKSRITRKLYNQLHFLDLDSYSELVTAEIRCRNLLEAINVFTRAGEYELAEKKALQLIKLAKKYCLTNEVVQGLEIYNRILVDGYLKKKKYKTNKGELLQQLKILALEREANILYNDFFIEIRSGVDLRHSLLSSSRSILDKMEALWRQSASPKIFKEFHKIKMTILEMAGQFEEQISFVKETNLLFKKGAINPHYFSINYNTYVLAYACLRTKRYEEGLKAAEVNRLNMSETNLNWFSNMENYVLLYVHSQNYRSANQLLEEVLSNPYFYKRSQFIQERWLLYVSFMNLLTGTSYRLVNEKEVSLISRDKKGFNVWLIILDFLTYLKQGKQELLQREAERTRKYTSKHLEAGADPRGRMFLKLLLLVVREDFDLGKVKQKSRYLVKKLEQTPAAGDAYAEVEIVPFEHLWEFVLDLLSKQKQ